MKSFKKELELKASYINPLTQKRALDLIDSGRLDVSSMVAQVCGLEKLEEILANPEDKRQKESILFLLKCKESESTTLEGNRDIKSQQFIVKCDALLALFLL